MGRVSVSLPREIGLRPESWASIVAAARTGDVILSYRLYDREHNNAVALRDYVNEKVERMLLPATAGAIVTVK